MDSPTQFDAEENARVFVLLEHPDNAQAVAETARIARETESISRLEEITRQIDQPFLGTFFTG
jgi:hypothetical protein